MRTLLRSLSTLLPLPPGAGRPRPTPARARRRTRLSPALLLALPITLAPAVSHAQVAFNYMNYYCLWDPSIHDYSITVHRFPGQTLVHTITDPAITSAACTADPTDLMTWIQHDLHNNGTWSISLWPNGSWGQSNDQIDTQMDVFCPDVTTVDYPTSLGSMYGTVYAPSYPGGNDQTSVNLNYACPDTPQNQGSGGGSTPVTATYAVTPCADGKVIGAILPDDSASIQQINLGSSTPGLDDWQMNIQDQSGPYQWFSSPAGTPHCDPSLMSQATAYLQGNLASVAAAAANVDATLSCDPGNTMELYIDSCEERGDDSVYGYQVACCPETHVTHGMSTGTNCHSLCLPVAVNSVTHFYGPTSPVYTNPATACNDLITDTTAWMDSSGPGGPTQPWICGPNWGVAQGGFYVPGSLNMTCNVVQASDPTCSGNARVDVCLTYQCEG